jgi:type II secretory pathway pseudopilin PulG
MEPKIQKRQYQWKRFHTHSKNGFSLLEMLFYIALLVLLLVVVLNSVLLMVTSYRNIKATEVIESSAVTALDTMVKDIQGSKAIDVTSVLNSNPGVLVINTGTTTPAQIKFDGGTSSLAVYEDGVYSGPLLSKDARIKTLIFRSIGTSTPAVKIELEIESGTSTSYRSKKFYETAILRGSYI